MKNYSLGIILNLLLIFTFGPVLAMNSVELGRAKREKASLDKKINLFISNLCQQFIEKNPQLDCQPSFLRKKFYIVDFANYKYASMDDNTLPWSINMSDMDLYIIPSEIGKFTLLKCIYLDNNNLEELPLEFKDLKQLKVIVLRNNKFSRFPEALLSLDNLRNVILEINNLNEIPSGIGQLTKLTNLSLARNCLRNIPSEIGNLKKLKYLDISHNKLKELPVEIENMDDLESLHLIDNPEMQFSIDIGKLKKLWFLNGECINEDDTSDTNEEQSSS